MYPTPYRSLYQLLFLSITISTTLPCFLCTFLDDPQYVNCTQPFECGNSGVLGDLKYPFWGINRASYCGKPGFKLSCLDNNTPVFNISTLDLRIIATNPQADKITVVFNDFWSNVCPSAVFNRENNTSAYKSVLSLNSGSLFTNSSIRFLTIFYSCHSDLGNQLGWLNSSSCSVNNKDVNVHFATQTVNVSLATKFCESVVSLPIPEEKVQALEERTVTLPKALDDGFDMNWLPLDDAKCRECVETGGQCGYNWTQTQFTCYCPDKPYQLYCPQLQRGSNKGILIGVSIGVVALVLVLLGAGYLFVRRRQKKQLVAQDKSRGVFPIPSSSNDGGGPHASTPGSNGLTSSHAYTSTPSTYSNSNASYMSSGSVIGKSYKYGVHVFDYTELEIATNNFDESKELGDGGFGTVYYGVLRDGRCVAVKRLYENSAKRKEQFENEIRLLADLEHKNLVRLYGCTSSRSRELLLVYEFIANGTVADHLHGKFSESTFLRWPARLNIAVETAEALAFLHRNTVIHRDVKTTNILLDDGFHVKVADFGLSREFQKDMTHVSTAPQGTPGYVDPEYYQCYRLTEKSDVYSFGVVLIELISSKQAVDITRHRHDVNLASMAVDRIQNQALHELVDPRLEFDKDHSVQAMVKMVAELGFQCLQPDREMRPTMDEVVARLRAVQLEGVKEQKQEVLDIIVYGDDVGLLTNPTPPLSPELPRSNDVV